MVTTNHGPAYLREKWSGPAKALHPGRGRALRAAGDASRPPSSTVQAAELTRALRPRGGRASPTASTSTSRWTRQGAERLLDGARSAPRRVPAVRGGARRPDQGLPHADRGAGRAATIPPLLVVGDLFHAPGYEERLRALARGLPVTFVPRQSGQERHRQAVRESSGAARSRARGPGPRRQGEAHPRQPRP